MCYEHGGMIDDGTLFRLGRDQFRWIGGDDYGGVWIREQAEKLGLKAMVRSSTDQLHNLAVQGPNSREIIRRMIWTAPHQPTVEELGWFRFTVGRIGGPSGAPGRGVADRLYRRVGVRGLLSPEGRQCGL